MYVEKIRGVVIQEVQYKDTDKIITVLAKGIGKVSILAKGARKLKNNKGAGTSLFSYCDFFINKSYKYYNLKDVEVIKTFYDLTKNYDNIFIATYMIENCNKAIIDNEPVDDVLWLLINCLNQLDKGRINNKLLLSIFELKFMQYIGYTPSMFECIKCGQTENLIGFYGEGVLCNECKDKWNISINKTVLYTMQYILSNDDKLFTFSIEDKDIEVLNSCTRKVVTTNTDYVLKSIDML